jgi:hypothetical protein
MPASFDRQFAATLDHLADARHDLREWLAREVPDPIARTDLLAVAGEFFLHVIVRTGGAGRARVLAEHAPDGVRLSVTAAADEPPVRAIDLPNDPLRVGAIGRRIVDGCCERVRVEAGAGVGAECWRRVEPAD